MKVNLYIYRALFFPFFLSTFVITAILLIDRIRLFVPFIKLAGVSFTSFLLLILNSLPVIFYTSIPLGLLMGVYSGINQLSLNSELVALRASGISLQFILKTVLIFSCFFSILLAIISFVLSPISHLAIRNLKISILQNQSKIHFQEKTINKFGDQMIYIHEKKEDKLTGILVANFENPSSNQIIEAEEGHIEFDKRAGKIDFKLQNGKIHFPPEGSNYSTIKFKSLFLPILFPLLEIKGFSTDDEMRKDSIDSKSDHELGTMELLIIMERSTKKSKQYNQLRSEFHERIIYPLTCMAFGLFAFPIGINNFRMQKKGNLLKLLLLVILYYTFNTQGLFLIDGGASPIYVYLPVVVTILLGTCNFIKVNYDFDRNLALVLK